MAASGRDRRDEMAIEWLLASDEPGIVMQVRRDLLDESFGSDEGEIERGPIVSRLINGQQPDGGFGVHPYQKWMGAHWRLVSLVELGVSAGEPHTMAALESVLTWLATDGDPQDALKIRDRYRVHGSVYANPLAVATRLGRASDPRVRILADRLVISQWPDGGWNCDRHPEADHSSFYETVTPMWALSEFARATHNETAAAAAKRAAQFFLSHKVFKSHSADRAGDSKWLKLRYPEYWHFDYLHGLVMLARVGALPTDEAEEAIALLRDQQRADGRLVPFGPQYWKGASGLYGDAAGWTTLSASQMLTLNALRVLKAVGS